MRTEAKRRIAAVALLAVCLVSLAAAADAPPGARIEIKDFMFTPMQLKTQVGVAVTWVNQDDEPHTIVSDTGLFRSSALDTGDEFSFRFETPGTYHVFCSIHPQMKATIVVE